MTGHGTPDPAWRHGGGATGERTPGSRSDPAWKHGAGTTGELASGGWSGAAKGAPEVAGADASWSDLVDAAGERADRRDRDDLVTLDVSDGRGDGSGRADGADRSGRGGADPGLQAVDDDDRSRWGRADPDHQADDDDDRNGRGGTDRPASQARSARSAQRFASPPSGSRQAVDLRTRARDLRELMDEADADPRALDRTFRRFALVNALVSGWRGVWRTHVVPALPVGGTARVLDLGCGGGDLARSIARWARGDGFDVEVVGVDPDPRAIAAAERMVPAGVSFRAASSADLVAAGEHFDVVVSNHVLHHLTDEERRGFLAESAALADARVVHGDIRRSVAAYRAYAAGSLLFSAGTFVRVDGLRSIRRSYTVAELASVLPAGWRSEAVPPHRVLAVHDA